MKEKKSMYTKEFSLLQKMCIYYKKGKKESEKIKITASLQKRIYSHS